MRPIEAIKFNLVLGYLLLPSAYLNYFSEVL